jgi:decaprenylphospho-beta-D-erythro-pentofuranosid-2-ulose 2-reductase
MEESAMTPSPKTALVVGATSSLAQAMCRELAAKGYALILAGRDELELEMLAGDLAVRHGGHCTTVSVDLQSASFSPPDFMNEAGDFDHIVIATGDMGGTDLSSLYNIAHTMRINYTLPAMLASLAADRMAGKKTGTIVIVSSIAGDRGRQSNYAYGSAKAALTAFTSGLRNRFAKSGVHVMTVKPGFIDTPMTWDMKSPLIASREYVAGQIIKAMEKKKDCIYVPFFWRYIMLIIMHIPEAIFTRLSL